MLFSFENSSSRKHAEAPESNKAWVLNFWDPSVIGTVKQREGLEDSTGPLLSSERDRSSLTVPNVAGHRRFPTELR